MRTTNLGRLFVATSAFALGTALAMAQDGEEKADDFRIVSVHLDRTMQPKSIGDTMNDCLNNPACKGVAVLLSNRIGVNEELLKFGVAQITSNFKGEEGHLTYKLPEGYRYCRSSVTVISVAPADGPRGSVLGVRAYDDSVGVYTWTPRRNLGEGRSWVEADFSIVGVKANKAEGYFSNGRCKLAKERLLLDCRGSACHSVQD